MARKISTDFPISEITLRKYEKAYEAPRRELIKKLCLSLGILQPGDSRDVIVDVLYCLLESKTEDKMMSSEEIREWVISYRKQEKLELLGIASSNIRRQIKRLRDIFLVEKSANRYRINENLMLTEIFSEKIERVFLSSIISRVKEYVKAIDDAFYKKI